MWSNSHNPRGRNLLWMIISATRGQLFPGNRP